MQLVRRWLNIGLSLCVFALTGIPGWTLPSYRFGASAIFAADQDQPSYTGTRVDVSRERDHQGRGPDGQALVRGVERVTTLLKTKQVAVTLVRV